MKIDGALITSLADAAENAKRLEAAGFDGAYTFEGNRDPFYPLLLAAEHTSRLDLATSIAVAFPRNPMHLAYQAWDLQEFSKGRFLLGLGSQVRAHVENRFGVAFSRPAARMRELVLAIKAIWRCWHDGEPLRFEGDFYTHKLMTPIFNAGPNPFGKPPLLIGGLGPKMLEAAGEVADGVIIHPFNTQPYFHELALPAIERGLARSGRKRDDFILSVSAMIITGKTQEEYDVADANDPVPAGLLWLHPGVQAADGGVRARRASNGAQRDVEEGAVDRDGAADRRRLRRRVLRARRAGDDRRQAPRALWNDREPPEHLRPLSSGPGPLAAHHRSPQGDLLARRAGGVPTRCDEQLGST